MLADSATHRARAGPGSPIQVSVAICTYNRAASLHRVLRSMSRMSVSEGLSWELLVVDNNSDDDTRETALEFRGVLPLRYVFEPVQGLSSARNRALAEYEGDLLVFVDDDVIVHRNWLKAYASAVRHFSAADYFGGRILPLWDDLRLARTL
jgi:glycosyltransferase involved in cell wall biosynthesis